jgi:hypothetical protein
MRPRLLIASLGVLAVVACGGSGGTASASPTPAGGASVNTCAAAHASSRHLAYLVVQHLSGQTTERCTGFDGDSIGADAVMKGTGIQYQTGGDGTVCQIDHEPQQFTDCSAGATDQAHWSLWVDPGSGWTQPTTPYGQIALRDHQALGWHYVLASPASPPPLPQPL